MSATAHGFIWYELITSDLDAASRFYGEVVGWSVLPSANPSMDYRLWSMAGQSIGGLIGLPAPGMAPAWLGYVNVDAVDASVARMVAAGGSVLLAANDIAAVGRIAMIADPQGAALYVMTPLGEGPSPAFAPGITGHGGWHELHTSDWQAALAFYSAEFGWGQTQAMDMGPMGIYLLFNNGGDAIGGMMNNPQVPHPAWLYYFCVDNINSAQARVVAAGGAVLNAPHEVPGGAWIFQAQDPQGAMFALVGPNVT